MRRLKESDRGVSLVLVAMSLTVLFGAAALAIDIGAIWLDRSTDQKITDSAASAGALDALTANGQTACESALAYVAVNANDIPSLDASGCATTFTGACDPLLARSLPPVTSGRYTITVTYPVPNGHRLMTSGIVGARTQALDPADGDPCERVAVEMTATRDSLFAQVLGFGQGQTTVHSVARAFLPPPEGPPLNLLVLDRFGCDAIHARGQGGVVVNPVVDPDTGEVFQGLAAADSDASSGCVPSVIHLEGNALLRADGPPGCADELTPSTGEGCGLIQALAPGTPGCNPPACTINGSNPVLAPLPTPLQERLTRKQVDYEYNCWDDYTWTTSAPGGVNWATAALTAANEQDIPPCPNTTDPHIYDLISAVGPNGRSGHSAWNADLMHPCIIDSVSSVTETGDIWIDCEDFVVEGDVSINGDVIFQGDAWVKSDGTLEILNTSANPGSAVFRGGVFRKDGQASLIIEQTAVYLSKSSSIEIAGGNMGTLRWVAPDNGRFENLALWSDSPLTHFWSGQGVLDMVGVFFTPLATADYSGSSGQNQTEAQWVADKLAAHGQGKLTIQPLFDFPVKRDNTPQTTLIR